MGEKLSIKLKSISVFSFAINNALLGISFGLFLGIFSSLIIKFFLSLGSNLPTSSIDTLPFLVIIIICPVIFGILGFIFGLILGLFINLVFKMTSGLKLNIEDQTISEPTAVVSSPSLSY
jgi:hypothetical protein